MRAMHGHGQYAGGCTEYDDHDEGSLGVTRMGKIQYTTPRLAFCLTHARRGSCDYHQKGGMYCTVHSLVYLVGSTVDVCIWFHVVKYTTVPVSSLVYIWYTT